jgi:hypothetical protein
MSRAIAFGSAVLLMAIGASRNASALDDEQAFQKFLLQPAIQNDLKAMVLDREPRPMRAECADLKVLEANEYNIVPQTPHQI